MTHELDLRFNARWLIPSRLAWTYRFRVLPPRLSVDQGFHWTTEVAATADVPASLVPCRLLNKILIMLISKTLGLIASIICKVLYLHRQGWREAKAPVAHCTACWQSLGGIWKGIVRYGRTIAGHSGGAGHRWLYGLQLDIAAAEDL